MKIQKVKSYVNFEANKSRFIGEESHKNLEKLLKKLDNDTIFKSNEYSFDSSRVTRITLWDTKKVEEKAELIDGRRSLDKIPDKNQLDKTTCLTIGKTELVIKNSNGEIIDFYKPFFKSWKTVIEQVGKIIQEFLVLYENPKLVMKHRFGVSGFTKKGHEIIDRIKVK